MTGVDHFNVMSLELLSGILVWAGAGWLLDRWLGTAHWFFGFGVMVGFAAGLYLVWLRTNISAAPPAPSTTAASTAATTEGSEAPRGGG
ncbi:MAG: AtpZ/AtpI family protein [Egibacteraceae bacterium]